MRYRIGFILLLVPALCLSAQQQKLWEANTEGPIHFSYPAWWYLDIDANYAAVSNSSEYLGAYDVDSGVASVMIALISETQLEQEEGKTFATLRAFHKHVVARETDEEFVPVDLNTKVANIKGQESLLTLGRHRFSTDICIISTKRAGWYIVLEGLVRSGEMALFGDIFFDIFSTIRLSAD